MAEQIRLRSLAESHRRQHEGEDYMAVARDIAQRLQLDPNNEDDMEKYHLLESSPRYNCDCVFCTRQDWGMAH